MAWIQPDGTVKLFNGIPLDNSYENCIYFSSRTACTTYFSNLTPKYTIDNMSYIRHSNNKIRVSICADNIIDCNYLCFQNSAFGNKWFYAFITEIEYTNNNSALITYEIDVINTYLWDCTLGTSYISRQHSITDNIGDNITDEPFNFNGYRVNKTHDKRLFTTNAFVCVIMDADTTYGNFLDNNYIRGNAIVGDLEDIKTLVQNHQEEIACISPIDAAMVNDGGMNLPINLSTTENLNLHATITLLAEQPTVSDTLDGYTPKNHKLYTAPYNMLRSISSQGNSTDFRYEFFGSGNLAPSFSITCNFMPPIQYVCRPYNYTDTNEVFNNYDKAVYVDNIPTSQWSLEQYKYWEASKGTSAMIQQAATMGGGALAGAAGGAKVGAAIGGLFMGYGALWGGLIGAGVGAIGGAIGGSIPAAIEDTNAHNAPDTWRISNTSSSALFSNYASGFALQNVCLNANEIEIIDNFFTKYGYAQNRLAVPNLHARPKWTYIKCNLTFTNSPIPSNANSTIRKIFDNGTTFWTTADYIGHYELDNSPT